MSQAGDASYAHLGEAVRAAYDERRALRICGAGSKTSLLGRRCEGEALSLAGISGVISYRPDEMVLTARAGTPVAEINELVRAAGQRLPFEPLADNGATLGGTIATGLSGPARPWRGAVRDAVLGTRLVNGRGELLRFGGEVMKNVAGYDVSRLQCGALGTLGVIAEVSLRLLPASAATATLTCSLDAEAALRVMRSAAVRPLPLSGACWFSGALYFRLEGSQQAVTAGARDCLQLMPDLTHLEDSTHWAAIREFSLPQLRETPLWCLSVAPAAALGPTDPVVIDWGGSRRFFRSENEVRMHTLATEGGGFAQRLWGGNSAQAAISEPDAPMRTLLRRVKTALDPAGIFNPGRLHDWM